MEKIDSYSTAYRLLIVLMAIFLTAIVSAQVPQVGVLEGIVKNENGQPAEKATITSDNGKWTTVTTTDGSYTLQLPQGKHWIHISLIGYRTEKREVNIREGSDTRLDISMDKIVAGELEEVKVESLSKKKIIETSGFAVNVVETKEASLRNLQTNELLDRAVGVRVRQNGGLGSNVEYNLNGMSGRSVGIFIDGIEISTYGSSFNLNNIPPAMIERIEVYKGVLPAHLSGDYMGGAINVVLKKDISQNNISTALSYGSFNTFQADAAGMYRNSKNGLTVKASVFYTYTDNNYETWGKFSKFIEPNGRVIRNYRATRFNDNYKSMGGRFEAGFTNVKWADQFLLGYNGSDTYKEIPHGQTMGRPYVGRFSEYQAHVLSVNYNKRNLLVDGLSFNFNGVHSNRNTYLQDTSGWVYNWDGNYRLDINGNPMYREGEGQQGEKVITDIQRKITTLRSNLAYDIVSGHRVSLNHVYYMIDRNDDDLLRPVGNDAVKMASDLAKNVLAFNYEAQVFNNKLRTNAFVKYYRQDVSRRTPVVSVVNEQNVVTITETKGSVNATGYGLAASYAIVPKFLIIGSGERAVRMPAEGEILGDPNENVLENFSIKPEVSNNYNMGFRFGSIKLNRHQLSVSASAFSRDVKDKIMRQANTNLNAQEIEVSPFVNIGRARSLGFEGELGYVYNNRLNAMFTFSKFNSLLKGTGSTEDRLSPYYDKQVPNEPFFNMNGNVQYRIDDLLQKKAIFNLFYNFGYVAPFRTVWPESEWFTTPTQMVHDVGVSYRFPGRKIVISLDAKNILNAEVYDNFGVQKPGRAFYMKVNYTINNF